MIRAILFDLDGTLYDRDLLVQQIVQEQYVAFKRELGGVDKHRFVARIAELDAHGYGSKPDLYARIVAEYGLPSELAGRLEAHFWDVYDQHCRPTGDTLGALAALRAAGLRMGVVTNGAVARQESKLAALGLGDFFDAVLVSEAEGIRKPDARIFHRAVERCGVSAAEAMFVGDHPEIDVAGSRAAGLTPVWKRVSYWSLPPRDDTLVIDALSEVLAHLR